MLHTLLVSSMNPTLATVPENRKTNVATSRSFSTQNVLNITPIHSTFMWKRFVGVYPLVSFRIKEDFLKKIITRDLWMFVRMRKALPSSRLLCLSLSDHWRHDITITECKHMHNIECMPFFFSRIRTHAITPSNLGISVVQFWLQSLWGRTVHSDSVLASYAAYWLSSCIGF
jgi:hypothetical protein